MLFNEACHRNVDLERPMYYNEANDGWYVLRAILLDFEPGITASVRDRKDDSSGSDNFLIDSVLGCGEDGGGRLRLPSRFLPGYATFSVGCASVSHPRWKPIGVACYSPGEIPDPRCLEAHCTRA